MRRMTAAACRSILHPSCTTAPPCQCEQGVYVLLRFPARQDEDIHASLRQLLSSARGRLTVACNILALVGMAPYVVIEVGHVIGNGGCWNPSELDCWTGIIAKFWVGLIAAS